MRRTPIIMTAAAILALTACNRSSPPNASAEAGGNVPAPASTPAAWTPPTKSAPTNAAAPAPGIGLWGVAEAEDAASHRGIDFIAFNRTGRAITALAIRPDEGPLDPGAPATPWSANVLAQRALADGTRAAAHFEADIELCRWQLRATFAGGQTRDYPAVNLCETLRVDLR